MYLQKGGFSTSDVNEEYVGYNKVHRSQANETTKWLYVETHLAISDEHVLCAIWV
jgi:hypothetical protein